MLHAIAQAITYSGPKFTGKIEDILTLVFGTLGAISVIVLIIAAIRLIIFGGSNPQELSQTRNTIIYAGIGLAVALSAMGIVQLVVRITT